MYYSSTPQYQWLLLVVRSLICPTQLSLAYDKCSAIYTLIPGGAAGVFNLWVVWEQVGLDIVSYYIELY